MKLFNQTKFLLITLILILLLHGCSPAVNKIEPTPTSTPSPTPVPTPIVDVVDICTSAFQNYVSAAPIAAIYDPAACAFYYNNQTPSTKMHPASTTKIFTAWVALQYLNPAEMVVVGDELNRVAEDASVADLKKGYVLSAAELVKGMMLPSGNDASYVLACHAGRTIAQNDNLDYDAAITTFMNEVNRQATLQGLTGTHFVTPDGYPHPDHYTTVGDLIQIATLGLSNPTIAACARIPKEEVQFSDGTRVLWENTNWLLHADKPYYLPEAIGLKTGHTDEAGYVLLTAVPNPHTDSIVIILVAKCYTIESRFTETISLYNVLKSVEIV